jgi:hypothetical protein
MTTSLASVTHISRPIAFTVISCTWIDCRCSHDHSISRSNYFGDSIPACCIVN